MVESNRNAATGAETCPTVTRPGRRQVKRETARRAPAAAGPSAFVVASICIYPLIFVQASVHARRSMQLLWPFPHWLIGVFQNLIER